MTATIENKPLGEVLNLRETAEYLKVSERLIWQMAKDNKLPHFRIGTQIRFRLADLRRLGQAD